MTTFKHNFTFDPSYGYSLVDLLKLQPDAEPANYGEFWRAKYQAAMAMPVTLSLSSNALTHPAYNVSDVTFTSTNNMRIGGWLLTPKDGEIDKGIIVGHGYGGRDAPDFDVPIAKAAILFLGFRGLSRSRCAGISDNPALHIINHIDDSEHYILRGCIEDLWLAATGLLALFPQVAHHLGYLGSSFGGGIGAMALAWDERFKRAALHVPSFGYQSLRLRLPTTGSGAAVQTYNRDHRNLMATLQYYDAAFAARHIRIPMHFAIATFDPVVAPPGQFAIYNATSTDKQLFILDAGHFEYPHQKVQEQQLNTDLRLFFKHL